MTGQSTAVVERPPRADRKNFFLGVVQGVSFHAANPFIQAATILPTFLYDLLGSHALCGFIITIQKFAQIAPQLWGARYLNGMLYKKPTLVGAAGVRALCWAAVAAATVFWGKSHPTLVVGLFFISLTLYYLSGGIGLMAFNDLTNKVIHPSERGSFFGWRGLLGGGAALLTALVARWILSRADIFPHPLEHGLLFLLAASFLALQVLWVLPIEEPSTKTVNGRAPLTDYLKDLVVILRSHRWFRTLVLVKVGLGGLLLATPFYVVFATERLGQPLVVVGTYTFLVMLAKSVGSMIWGQLEDRFGHTSILVIVGWLGITAPVLAIFSDLLHPGFMYGTFFILGLCNDSKDMLVRNYLLENSPADSVPVFTALLNTLAVPIMVYPLIGALIIRLASYQALFIAAMAIATVGIGAAVLLAHMDSHQPLPKRHA